MTPTIRTGGEGGWQPIETAPQYPGNMGPEFIAAQHIVADMWVMIFARITAKGDMVHAWDHSIVKDAEIEPTHWRAMPEPPAPGAA
jgi:hypothetical protein